MAIHPTAIIHPKAQVAASAQIGPYCVVHQNVVIEENVCLDSHVVIDGWTTIGAGSRVHPFALVGGDSQVLKFKGEKTFVKIGPNTTLREYVTVNGGTGEGTETVIGAGCHIMAYAHIAHNCIVGNNVVIANCGTLAGHVTVEDKVVIGGLVAIHQFCQIGTMSIIGGCSKVIQDIPPFMMADGHPAVVRGLNLVAMKRRQVSEEAQKEIKKAFKLIYKSDLNTTNAVKAIQEQKFHTPEVAHLLNFISKSERGISKP
jgi:UDP-N-acetylglucosamine acyltransferase